MNVLDMLFRNRIDLSNLLENLVKDNSDFQIKWTSNAYDIEDQVEFRSYLNMQVNEADRYWLQQFLDEFMPLYEQLSVYHDFYHLRLVSLSKDSYSKEEFPELEKATMKASKDLLLRKKQRVEEVALLDSKMLEKRNISRDKLLYLAENTHSTLEIFDLLENKMKKNPSIFPINSDATNKKLADCFEKIDQVILAHLLTPKDEIIVYYLTYLLIDFYDDLKDLMDGMNGRRLNFR